MKEGLIMIFISSLPFLFACTYWYRQQHSLFVVEKNIDLLSRLKQLCRSSIAVPCIQQENNISRVFSNAVDMGLSCAGGIEQALIWLRVFKIKCHKAHKLVSVWLLRFFAVIILSIVIRCYFSDSFNAAMFGISANDRYLLLGAGMVSLAGTLLFLKLVPTVVISTGNEVFGLAPWLRDRILAEGGFQTESKNTEIHLLESSEMNTGISLINEKLEAMDQIWRSRIDAVEKKTDAAEETMPFLELVFFGLFIVCLLLEPALAFGT
jgi:hypothetical protein